MLCAISGESPQHPVASRKSGTVFEKHLIESYIAQNGTDPVTGEELSVDDLLDLKQSRTVKPRPPTLTSIPALLSTFQNEWDALVLETFELRKELAQTRQELSTALYYNDSAQRVLARVASERDEAREALARVTVNSTKSVANGGGDAMQVDDQTLPEDVLEKIDSTQQRLQSTRRKRPVPEDWATGASIATYAVKSTTDTQFTGSKSLAADPTGSLFLCGDSDGTMGIYDLRQNTFTTRSNLASGAILAGIWASDKAVVATSSGAVVASQEGSVVAKFTLHAGAATAVAAHPCGDIVASAGEDGSWVLYDLRDDGKVLTQVFAGAALTTLKFHPDGHLVAAGTVNGTIELYDVKTRSLAHTFPSPTNTSTAVTSIDFSENGTWLASSNAGSTGITIWHLGKLNVLKTLDAGMHVTRLSWDYTGQFLAAAGRGGVVVNEYSKAGKVWSEPLRKAVEAFDVAWGKAAGSLVVLGGEGGVSVLGA